MIEPRDVSDGSSWRGAFYATYLFQVHRRNMLRFIRLGKADRAAASARAMWHELTWRDRERARMVARVRENLDR